jgi:cell division transport system ATP-binding protein
VVARSLIQLIDIDKQFLGKEPIFRGLSARIDAGEFVFLTGISGAGKSTLFRLILGLEKPDKGRIRFGDREVTELGASAMNLHRRTIGMVFQDYKLLEKRTAAENIAIPLLIKGDSGAVREKKVRDVAEKLRMAALLKQTVLSLSGGEQQLVAIARAAVHDPVAIFADEPTANLDPKMGNRIFQVLTLLNTEGMTVIVATHDIHLIRAHQRRVLLLKNGVLLEVQ